MDKYISLLIGYFFVFGCSNKGQEPIETKIEIEQEAPQNQAKSTTSTDLEVVKLFSQLDELEAPIILDDKFIAEVNKKKLDKAILLSLIPEYKSVQTTKQLWALGKLKNFAADKNILFYIENDTDREDTGYDDFVVAVYSEKGKIIDQLVLSAAFSGFGGTQNYVKADITFISLTVEEMEEVTVFGEHFGFPNDAFQQLGTFDQSFDQYNEFESFLHELIQ